MSHCDMQVTFLNSSVLCAIYRKDKDLSNQQAGEKKFQSKTLRLILSSRCVNDIETLERLTNQHTIPGMLFASLRRYLIYANPTVSCQGIFIKEANLYAVPIQISNSFFLIDSESNFACAVPERVKILPKRTH